MAASPSAAALHFLLVVVSVVAEEDLCALTSKTEVKPKSRETSDAWSGARDGEDMRLVRGGALSDQLGARHHSPI